MPDPFLRSEDSAAIRPLSEEEIAFVEKHPDWPISQEWMGEIRLAGQLISCRCGRILHVVERKNLHFLRRNPKQDFDDEIQCEICTFEIQPGKYRGGKNPYQPAPYGLLLRVKPEATGDGDGEGRTAVDSIKNKLMFSTLHRMAVEAGWGTFEPTITPTGKQAHSEFWNPFQEILRKIRIPRTSQSMADFSWVPLKLYSGGMRGLNDRLKTWTRIDLPPECWLFAEMMNSPAEGTAYFFPSPTVELNPRYKPYRATFEPTSIGRIGTVGPWLLFGVGARNDFDDQQFALPIWKKCALQMIVANDWPMPIENTGERSLALKLRETGIGFVKCLFDDRWGLRPDFAIPSMNTLIGVDSSPEPEIREVKQNVIRRLRQVYSNRRVLVWEAFSGEPLEDFIEIVLKNK